MTAAATAVSSVTSATNANAPTPISATTSSSSAAVREMQSTVAPARASSIAHARPIPRPAPVTSATRPSSDQALTERSSRIVAVRPCPSIRSASQIASMVGAIARVPSSVRRCQVTVLRNLPTHRPPV